jgi:hypothetical protein
LPYDNGTRADDQNTVYVCAFWHNDILSCNMGYDFGYSIWLDVPS